MAGGNMEKVMLIIGIVVFMLAWIIVAFGAGITHAPTILGG